MGECGCASNALDMAKLDTPTGIYVIQLYPGCTDCARLTGIQVVKYSSLRDYETFTDTRNIKDLKDIDEYGYSFPVVEWVEVGKAIQANAESLSEYATFEDFWSDHEEYMREACWNTIKKFQEVS